MHRVEMTYKNQKVDKNSSSNSTKTFNLERFITDIKEIIDAKELERQTNCFLSPGDHWYAGRVQGFDPQCTCDQLNGKPKTNDQCLSLIDRCVKQFDQMNAVVCVFEIPTKTPLFNSKIHYIPNKLHPFHQFFVPAWANGLCQDENRRLGLYISTKHTYSSAKEVFANLKTTWNELMPGSPSFAEKPIKCWQSADKSGSSGQVASDVILLN